MMKPSCTALLVLVLTLLSVAGPATATAPADTTTWTPELAMQYPAITETAMAPDGAHVAYVVRKAVMDETTSTYRQQIH
ncbi:MAG: hypothetical protein GVY15_01390, partial [Bacteroidetes bacterium]|nr:hypothetical protein [Bacteroidota bacterium]